MNVIHCARNDYFVCKYSNLLKKPYWERIQTSGAQPPTGVEKCDNMNITTSSIDDYLTALAAETYKVQLKNRLTQEGFWVEYSSHHLRRAVGYLRGKNANGFDVYARPVGWQYVLLDDLTPDVLPELAHLQPCLLIETSPGNFQAWLTLAQVPPSREVAKSICQELAIRFSADLASAEPDHVGRLPGLTNRKPNYQMTNGQYPFVKLRRWANRTSTFYPRGGAVLQYTNELHATTHRSHYRGSTRTPSEQDFGVACGLLRIGRTEEQVYQHLLSTSPDLTERKGKHVKRYLLRTISNATIRISRD